MELLLPLLSSFGRGGTIIGGTELSEILERKQPKSYSNKIMEIVDSVTFNSEEANAVGSATFSIFKYPSDIDCFETISDYGTTKPAALKFFVSAIQKIIKKITIKKGFWLADFKAGKDPRFEIDVGGFSKNHLTGHDHIAIERKLIMLVNQKLIKPEDYQKLMELNKNLNVLENYEKFKQIINKKYATIRWQANDILRGSVTHHGKKFKLSDCIDQPGIVKVDAFTFLGGTRSAFIECSNFIMLKWSDKSGKEYYTNVPPGEQLSSYLTKSIQLEMRSLCNPESSFYNLYKFAKRLFAMCAINKDEKLLKILDPLLTSSLSQISQLAADCETLISMTEKLKKLPFAKMLEVVNNFKPRISSISNAGLNKDTCYQLIDNISQAGKYNTVEGFNNQLNELHDYLKDIVKKQAEAYVKKKKIVKLAEKYLQ